jgi:predicted nucleic acid-binding protein
VSTATPGHSVVFDASAALRAVVDRNDQALYWFAAAEQGEVDAAWPELALVEIAHGLLRLVRGGRLASADAFRETARFIGAPIRVESLGPLTLPALHLAAERALSVYDATYLVLAESLDAQLVTADRQLAAAAEKSVLIGG